MLILSSRHLNQALILNIENMEHLVCDEDIAWLLNVPSTWTIDEINNAICNNSDLLTSSSLTLLSRDELLTIPKQPRSKLSKLL